MINFKETALMTLVNEASSLVDSGLKHHALFV